MFPNLRITLDQWRALVAVVDGGTYANAASTLHKSQSSVTYLVQKLESQLGVKVFEARGRKSVLTPTGQLLYRRASMLIEEAAGVEKAACALSAGWEAEIGLAAEILFPQQLLLQCLDAFGRESPHTRIELIESVLQGATEALADGRANLGISGQIPIGMTGEMLVQLRATLVASPSHPLHALGRQLTPRDLRAHRQMVIRETDSRRSTRSSIDTAQRWTVSSMSTSLVAVKNGMGFGWFPLEYIADELASGALRPLPMREGRERILPLYLVHADREQAGPGVLRLAQIIHERTSSECRRVGDERRAPPTDLPRSGRSRRSGRSVHLQSAGDQS